MSDTESKPTASAEVWKSELPSLLVSSSVGIDGELFWPIDPLALLRLYLTSPEHCRAIHIKAAGAYGLGLRCERDADQARLDAVTVDGTAALFTDLGVDEETYGNCWLETVRDARGKLLRLTRLPSVTMIRLTGDRALQRVYEGDTEKRTPFAANQTKHLRPSCPGGGYYAYPSWIGANGMMALARAATDFNAAFFDNHAMPEHVVITKGFELTAAQKEATKQFFRGEFKGLENAHRTLYLHLPEAEHEVEFKRVTAELKDADFLKLLDAARDRMPIAHGVPPRMLGIVSAGSLGGGGEVTGQLHLFELLTLRPMRARMLQQLAPLLRELGIDPRGVQFEGIDLTPPDVDSSQIANWVAAGVLTADEAREWIGQDGPAPGGLTKADEDARMRLLLKAWARS
ncbi:MAG: phage portal protein [Burkholderiaceae bacterium]|nr:phage portal protein [Zoogloeaceae bacterium]MCP5290918.1 phage portal protein [Burkholderiaceae bacterium]